MPTITLVGDRQSGKTHALLNLGAVEAENGHTVAYIADQLVVARNSFERYVELHAALDTVDRVYRANGEQRVRHKSGGIIYFHGGGRRPYFDPAEVDVFLIDGLPEAYDWVTEPACAVNPDVRVYRTSL